jgi:hypothetical protein
VNLLQAAGFVRKFLTAVKPVTAESRHPDPAIILQAGGTLLNDLRTRGAILGSGQGAL